ncbi:hypothetical protein OUZ56_028363 [Daphnia magna]|uniref:CB1 cannabinoid receptor-interacting protein 1 n=1 Tax=Daphnia magna TaxID=35525 RepID=A0ABR0B479_9CRUS|nr:hypothetical protein OUZ56_028363 [Daphnia magna]
MGSFRVTLSLNKEPDNKPVFCKVDGQRFAQPRTVKFLAGSKYRFDINIRPAKTVRVSVTSWIAISYGSIEKSNGSLHGMSRNTTTDWIPTTSFRPQKKLASRTWLLNVILGISTLVGQ